MKPASLTMTPSVPPPKVLIRFPAVGKSEESVLPTAYTPLESTAMRLKLSVPVPPRYVENKRAEPLAESSDTNPSVGPPIFVDWIALSTGRFGELVLPEMKMLPLASVAEPKARSFPDPPKYVEKGALEPSATNFVTKVLKPPLLAC